MAIGRLFRGLAKNIDQTRKEKIADMSGLEDRMDSPSIPGSFTFPGGFNFLGGGFIPNIANIANIVAQQQGPVLGPDDFGSYVIPASDPTYSSGFDYARSIAGGMPMSQVIAPGVSYSPEQPMGYTQEQLNTAVGTTPVEPPPPPPEKLPAPGETGYGQGIGGVTIFDDVFDRKRMPPPRDIFGGTRDVRDAKPLENLLNIGKLFGGGIDQDAIDRIVQERIAERMPTIEQPDLSQFVRREDIPSLIPEVPTGREFSIEDIRSGLDLPDFTKFARQEDIPSIPTFVQPDLSGFVRQEDIPTFDPTGLQEQITALQQRPNFDPTSIQQDISQLQTRPQFDPTGLQEQIGLLQQDIGQITPFNPTSLQQQIGGLEQQITGIPQFDPSGLQEQISGLQQQIGGIPQFDPTGLQAQIAANQAALAGIDIPTAPDVSQFVTQEDIQRAISGIDIPTFQAPDFSPYETRIAELEQQIAGLQVPTGGRFSVDRKSPIGLF